MQSELNELKKYFSLPDHGAYLNCAAHGPLSKPASEAVIKSLRDKEHPKDMDHSYAVTRAELCRKAVAKLVGSRPDQVALANSTSWGINALAQGLNLRAGDEVIAFAGQFPSNIAPWEPLEKRGVKIRKVPARDHISDLKLFKENLNSSTRVATLEWVHFVSGDRIALEDYSKICHERGIVVVVDVTQGLGAIPFSFEESGVDAIVCSAYKWLYSPYGSGFMVLNDRLLDHVATPNVNWLSLNVPWTDNLTDYEVTFSREAQRFDVYAHMGYLNMDGMTASINLLNTFDIEKNFKYVRGLARQLNDEFDPKFFRPLNRGPQERQSCIATFSCPDVNGDKLIATLQQNGFTACIRSKSLRVAPSIYNDSRQISEFTRLANQTAASL